ncbi:hypothetical protein C8Q78DRAFT_425802 [Trametes maxima]|nr:hypothetical protein C8Q78DRAFT_425802 [Trametes maxima]
MRVVVSRFGEGRLSLSSLLFAVPGLRLRPFVIPSHHFPSSSRTAPPGQPSTSSAPAMDRPSVSPRIYTASITPHHQHINSHSPPTDNPSRDKPPSRSPSPPATHQHYHQHQHQHQHPLRHLPPPHSLGQEHPASQHEYQPHHAYPDYPRPDSRLSDSRLLPPPSAVPARHAATATADEATPPASPPHKRFKHENSLPPPYPCHVDQRWVRVRHC